MTLQATDLSAAHYDDSLLLTSHFQRISFHRQDPDGFNNDVLGWRDGGNGTCYLPFHSEGCNTESLAPPFVVANQFVSDDKTETNPNEVAAVFVDLRELEHFLLSRNNTSGRALSSGPESPAEPGFTNIYNLAAAGCPAPLVVVARCGAAVEEERAQLIEASERATGATSSSSDFPTTSNFLSRENTAIVHNIIQVIRETLMLGFSDALFGKLHVVGLVLGAAGPAIAFQSCKSMLIAPLKIVPTSISRAGVIHGGVAPTPARIVMFSNARIAEVVGDVTHNVTPESPFYPGGQRLLGCPAAEARLRIREKTLKKELIGSVDEMGLLSPPNEEALQSYSVLCGCDVGTHIDSPQHFFADPQHKCLTQLTVEADLVLPTLIIDVRGQCEADPDYAITAGDIHNAMAKAKVRMDLKGAFVVALTGWCAKFIEATQAGKPELYQGIQAPKYEVAATDDDPSAPKMHFPGFSQEAASFMVQSGVAAIGIDTLSLDCGLSEDFIVHQIMLGANKFQVENLNLTQFLASDVGPQGAWHSVILPIAAEGAFEGMGRVALVRFNIDVSD